MTYLDKLSAVLAIASGSPAAANAIEAYDLAIDCLNEKLERQNAAKRSLGGMPHATATRYLNFKFKTPLRVTGVPSTDTAEVCKCLYQACGLTETENSGDGSETYITIANNPNSVRVNITVYKDGVKYVGQNGLGTLKIIAPVGQLGWIEWEFMLQKSSISSEAIPSNIEDYFPDPATYPHQPVCGAEYAIGAWNDSAGSVGRAFEFTLGNVLKPTKDHADTTNGGVGPIYITDRKPVGKFTIEEPAIGTKDFYSDVYVNNPSLITGQVNVGSGADKVVQIYVKAQLDKIDPVNNEGIKDLDLPFSCSESAGNIDDQFYIHLT